MTVEREIVALKKRVKELEDCLREVFGITDIPKIVALKKSVADLVNDSKRVHELEYEVRKLRS